MKTRIINGLDPKKWPSFQKIILRVIQNNGYSFYSESCFDKSPDYKILQEILKDKYDSWWIENEDDLDIDNYSIKDVPIRTKKKWYNDAKIELFTLLKECGIDDIPNVDYDEYLEVILKKLIAL